MSADAIALRAQELLLDGPATVDLIEEIQAEGGPDHQTLCLALRRVVENAPESSLHEFGLDMAAFILAGRANARATRELTRSPA